MNPTAARANGSSRARRINWKSPRPPSTRKLTAWRSKPPAAWCKVWPLSDYAPRAQYLVARCYEATGKEEKAFKAYQTLLEKQPKIANCDEILQRQYQIANQFLAGKWFKLWGYIPFFPSMERTAKMYGDIVKTGPYSPVAPQAQLNIGTAWEKQKTVGFKTPDYPAAIQAYDTAADRYHDQPKVASEAIFRAGLAYQKEAQTPDRDQTNATHAIAKFTDFIALYPNDPRVPQGPEDHCLAQRRSGARQLRHRAVLRETQEVGRRADLLQRGPVAGSQFALCDRGAAADRPTQATGADGQAISMNLCRWLLVGLVALGGNGCAGYKLGPVNGLAAGAKSVQVNPFTNTDAGTPPGGRGHRPTPQTVAAGRHLPTRLPRRRGHRGQRFRDPLRAAGGQSLAQRHADGAGLPA